MIFQDLEKLVFTLSPAERKQFQNYSKRFNTTMYYFVLYNLILMNRDEVKTTWQKEFSERYPDVSLESTANYLFKVLIDVLVQIRVEQNTWYQQLHGLMKAQLCFERSLQNRGLKEIQSVYTKAVKSENLINIYNSLRMELDTMHTFNFSAIKEQYLVDKQMEAKMIISSINEVQEHNNLYELLSLRVANNSKKLQNSDDLIFGELNLIFNKNKPRFETKKMHLMFQSFYFIDKGDFQSALKIFKELSFLFESNPTLWSYPPYDYLATLDGILNSLRSTFQFEQMQEFIDKVNNFQNDNYSEHFRNKAEVTAYVYQLNCFIRLGNYNEAESLVLHYKKKALFHISDQKKRIESYYFQALLYFQNKKFTNAKRLLNELFNNNTSSLSFVSFRASKILYILTIYELDDYQYVESEIRAYKRVFQKLGKLSMTEKLVFKLIRSDPKRRGNEWKKKNLLLFGGQFEGILLSKSDTSFLKFFDYYSWIRSMLRTI